jgi:hypothetical protein
MLQPLLGRHAYDEKDNVPRIAIVSLEIVLKRLWRHVKYALLPPL